jgi:TonB family protein
VIAAARPGRPARNTSLFQASLGVSLAAHLLLFGFLERKRSSAPATDFKPEVIDVDIRTPFRPRDPKDKRLPGTIPGAPAPLKFKREPFPLPLPKEQTKPAAAPKQAEEGPVTGAKPQQWVLPGPKTEVLNKPTLDGASAEQRPAFTSKDGTGPGGQNGIGGSGGGPGTGDALVNRPPRLINREEVMASLKRLYPEVERRAGRQGKVILEIDIDASGVVRGIEVVGSAGDYFDDAARSVGKIMRFEPELRASVPTRSRKKQSVYFQLTND